MNTINKSRSGKPRRFIKVKIKDNVRERDGFCCRICLAHVDSLDHQLQVHHIRPIEMGGKDRYSNLVSLCNHCHANVHENVHIWIKPLREYVQLYKSTGSRYAVMADPYKKDKGEIDD